MYCLKCKRMTESKNLHTAVSKNKRNMLKGTCSVFGTKKCKFIAAESSTTTGGDLTNSINKFTSKLKLPWASSPEKCTFQE